VQSVLDLVSRTLPRVFLDESTSAACHCCGIFRPIQDLLNGVSDRDWVGLRKHCQMARFAERR
jgi:hypothetical protein